MEGHLMVCGVKIPTVQVKGVLARKELLEEFHNQTWQGFTPLSSTA
ncbi:hypothetical protein AM1_6123 [Acaryochloris marina MBIC11017]|uniref:Uncharacterized protein n=1 Tax=Acaryochloris marina (strain MBIC 11017) TaxID=329726 RepID=B0C4R5_ACAM1|nr:hypothetical protein AM1_6121 [Acaryochloris marina MBIC11017]ABW31055.1 hypothetical protein AM1_6123 [Acaryochloris marina MBIC11017]